jgi:hypothetical protein
MPYPFAMLERPAAAQGRFQKRQKPEKTGLF